MTEEYTPGASVFAAMYTDDVLLLATVEPVEFVTFQEYVTNGRKSKDEQLPLLTANVEVPVMVIAWLARSTAGFAVNPTIGADRIALAVHAQLARSAAHVESGHV